MLNHARSCCSSLGFGTEAQVISRAASPPGAPPAAVGFATLATSRGTGAPIVRRRTPLVITEPPPPGVNASLRKRKPGSCGLCMKRCSFHSPLPVNENNVQEKKRARSIHGTLSVRGCKSYPGMSPGRAYPGGVHAARRLLFSYFSQYIYSRLYDMLPFDYSVFTRVFFGIQVGGKEMIILLCVCNSSSSSSSSLCVFFFLLVLFVLICSFFLVCLFFFCPGFLVCGVGVRVEPVCLMLAPTTITDVSARRIFGNVFVKRFQHGSARQPPRGRRA